MEDRRLADIRNACWFVRRFHRPGQEELRAKAILELGMACRAAFSERSDFEPVLLVILDGLSPQHIKRF